jgi:hypothetical protein
MPVHRGRVPEALLEPDAFRRWMGARFFWWLDHTDDPLPENDQEQERIRRYMGLGRP